MLLCVCTLLISWREGEFEIDVCTEHIYWYFLWFRIFLLSWCNCFVLGVIHRKFCSAWSKWEVFGINSLPLWAYVYESVLHGHEKIIYEEAHIKCLQRSKPWQALSRFSVHMRNFESQVFVWLGSVLWRAKGSHENGVILTSFRVGLCCNSLKHSLPFPYFTCQLELINYEQMTGLLVISKTLCCG